jgi:tetrahydromethanopterin S-methyltransferase subunit C
MFVVSRFSRCSASYGLGSGVGDMGVVGLVDNEFGRFGDNQYVPRT